MKKCFLILCFFTDFLQAAEELVDTMPVELAKAYLSASGLNSPSFFAERLEGFPPLRIPAEFETVGSVISGISKSLVLSTSIDQRFANDLLEQSLRATGALQYPNRANRQNENGFIHIYDTNPDLLIRFCSDEWGDISLSFRESMEINTVVISNAGLIDPRPCSTRIDEAVDHIQKRQEMSSRGLRAYLPTIELPQDDAPRPAGIRGSGSEKGYMISTRLVTDLPIESLHEHISGQLETQGWLQESNNGSENEISSSWGNLLTPGSDFLASIHIERVSDSGFALSLTIEDRLDADFAPRESFPFRAPDDTQ